MAIINIRVWARKAHRRLGIGCMIVLLGLSVTGIILNHPDTYKLHDDFIPYWMADLFYQSEFPEIRSYPANESWLSQMNDALYFNGTRVAECPGKFTGAVSNGDRYAASCAHLFHVLDGDGALVDTVLLSERPLDDRASATICEGELCIFEGGKSYRYAPDEENVWADARGYSTFAIARQEPKEVRRRMVEPEIEGQFSWQKVVEDLHSGQLGGAWGVLIVDTTWVFTIIICITGLYIWIFQLRRTTWD